jgi:large subunit ribosomal protein L25
MKDDGMKNTDKIEIPVSTRHAGKHESRQSRMKGQIPAVIYGPKTEPVNVLTEEVLLRKYTGSRFESTIFVLKSEDSQLNKMSVILRNVQVDAVTRRPLHVDFYAPDMTKPVRVSVELRVEGKPAGLAEGGLLEHMLRSIEVEVLPNDIPEFMTADVSHLGLGDALHVSDLQVPAGVKILSLPTLTIATVAIPREEAAATPTAEAAPAAGAAPAAAAAPAAGAKGAPAKAAPAKAAAAKK